jgi:hypothetical protein
MKQGLPATLREGIDTQKAKGEFSSVPLGTTPPSVLAIIARPVDSSPPHDVQSFFCTFRI